MATQTLPVKKSMTKVGQSVSSYAELKRKVKERFAFGQKRMEAEKVRTYWEAGKLIDRHILGQKKRAEYGKQVIGKLSQDVGVSGELLYKMLEFARNFPILPMSAKLEWSHYVALLAVNNEIKRQALLAKAEKSNWPVEKLEGEVKKINQAEKTGVIQTGKKIIPTLAIPKLGSFYTCKIVQPKSFPGVLRVDLGLENYEDLARAGIKNVKEGEILFTDGISKILKKGSAEDLLYTYKAYIEKIVDGDTLRLNIDLGFGFWNRRYLRLRGIDSPELSTKAGKAAQAFVESELKGLSMITLRTTTQTDIHNRYIADVFYGKENIHLNQRILDAGFAKRM